MLPKVGVIFTGFCKGLDAGNTFKEAVAQRSENSSVTAVLDVLARTQLKYQIQPAPNLK